MENTFFSYDELKNFQSCINKKLQNVYYHIWMNETNPNQKFEFLYILELVFTDKTTVKICRKEEESENQLMIYAIDLAAEKNELKEFTNEQIQIKSFYGDKISYWNELQGKTLTAIEMEKDDNLYLNDSLVFAFDAVKILVLPEVEGISVKPFQPKAD